MLDLGELGNDASGMGLEYKSSHEKMMTSWFSTVATFEIRFCHAWGNKMKADRLIERW